MLQQIIRISCLNAWFLVIILFNASLVLAKTTDTVSNLDHDKLIEAAKLGNMDAQYRYAKLIDAGIIKDGTYDDYISLIEAAAKQGHEFAAYDLFDAVDFKCRTATDFAQTYGKCIAPVKVLLSKLGTEGKAHANWLLFNIWNTEIFIDHDTAQTASDQQEQIPHYFLVKAAELGSRAASIVLSARLHSGYNDVQDPALALEILEKALQLPKDYSRDEESHKIQTCNILYYLHEYYSGTKTIRVDQERVDYLEAVDPIKNFNTLQLGANSSCMLLMYELAKYNLSQPNPDYFTNYILLLEALALYEAADMFDESLDGLNVRLAEVAIALGDVSLAKKHLSSIKTRTYRDIIYSSYGLAQTVCSVEGIDAKDCTEFIGD